MNQASIKTPCWVRGGKLDEIVWIGKDVLAWCSGLYIVFFHVAKRQETLRWCWSEATGDGARCVSGHVSASVFAFAERSLNPRILVYAYPSMTRISECPRECESGYLAIAFTPHEHLVSLGSYPNFPLIVWCWRTGEKIAIVDTPILDEVGQRIKITPSGRTVIGQIGKTCGDLLTWELDVVGDLVILKDHEVRLPQETRAYGIDWCPGASEPLLAITDHEGHIYLSNYDGSDVRRIVFSQRCGICVKMEMPAVCWFRGGIILRTTFCQIRYFRQEPRTNFWHKQWYVKSIHKPHVLVAHPFRSDWLFYYTLEGYLMQIMFPEKSTATPMIYRHLHCGGTYRFVDFVRPWCHHLVVTDDLKDLTILESYGGGEIARIDLDMEGDLSAQASHPDDPLIVVVSDQGEMVLVGITDPENPTILERFRLQRKPLDIVKFSHTGRFVIAAHKETGNCYCVNVRRDKPWEVVAQVQTRRRLADVMLQDNGTEYRGHLKAFALFMKYEMYSAVGQEIFVYDVSRPDRPIVDEAEGSIILPDFFRDLCDAAGDVPRMLIGSPYLKRELYLLRLQRDLKDVELVDAMLTGHHMRLARIFTDRRWIVTCAYDGLVIVRDETVSRIVIVVPAHHRFDSGSTKAIVSHEGNMMIALGHDGSLVAVRLRISRKNVDASSTTISTESMYQVDNAYYEKRKEEILANYASLDPEIRVSLTRARQALPFSDKTWEEWQQELQLQREEKMYAAQRAAIMRDLAVLKATVKRFLDDNETVPEIKRLPVSAFDLDRAGRDHKLKIAKDEREEVRMELEHLCESMANVAAWIKSTFWDPQVVLGRSIFSFCGDIEVTNYPMLEKDPYFKDHLQWAQFNRDAERTVIIGDTFQSWRAYTDEQLQMELSKPLIVYREDEKRRMDVLLEEEEREIHPEEPTEEPRALDGMTTHQFVEQSPYYYSQMDSYGFAHATLEDRYLMDDCTKLHEYFNRLFDDIFAAKEREMAAIREKNEKIRHIDSELKLMFGESVPLLLVDPEWHHKEKVESIIQVEEHEVKVKPYVSPSQQEILEKQAAETERLRRELLADDFRERALMRMMDGVLEIRWEDTIKVDVRKPACMLKKQPEQYTAEDILVVKKYEADVEILRQERERYKRMLEAEYIKINTLREESINKFDAKVNELFQLKLKIDAAINQLKLRHIRGRLRNMERIKGMKEDDRMKSEISKKRQREVVLEGQVQQLHDIYQDMLAQHDALCNREKTIAKKLQYDFATLSKSNFELLERQYKRKPRVSLKNVAACDLTNLADYLVNHMKPTYLPVECADYLKILDNLDARPIELPQSIDTVQWNYMIRLRRQKIEVELRIKARQLEIAAVERTIGVFEGNIEMCRSNASQLREQLKHAREERATRELDQEIQLVLKRGQVEIDMRGELRDTANAILIPRSEILRVNEHIRAAGARKLDALKRMIDFRQKLATVEWEHRCLRTRYRDLQEDLRFVNDITVTRDMRMYLKRKAKGLRDDKTEQQLEKEIENTKSSLEKALSREKRKLENVREKIARVRQKNAELDRNIMEMNVRRWELKYQHDPDEETRQRKHVNRRMQLFRQRAELIRKVQDNYAELLTLQTEHELLRMRTYPTLDYFEALDDEQSDKVCQ